MKQITLTETEYKKVQTLMADGLREFEAVASVLGIDSSSDFVTSSTGSSSCPKNGLIVTFP